MYSPLQNFKSILRNSYPSRTTKRPRVDEKDSALCFPRHNHGRASYYTWALSEITGKSCEFYSRINDGRSELGESNTTEGEKGITLLATIFQED